MQAKIAINTAGREINIDGLSAGIDKNGNKYFSGTIHIDGEAHTGQFSATEFEYIGILLDIE